MSVVIDGTLGITSPAETVQGALTTTGNTILGDASTDTLNVGNGGLVKDASGNVGIGTASPTGILHTVATNGVNILESAGVSSVGLRLRTNSVDRWQIQVPSGSSDLAIYTGAAATQQAGITNAGLFQFNSGYGSVATAYGCRAWVNFNGTGTVAIRASGNVSSITDSGVGTYTVNFTTAMVDVNYTISSGYNTSVSNLSPHDHFSWTGTSSFLYNHFENNLATDSSYLTAQILR